jgi:hypothetical protein
MKLKVQIVVGLVCIGILGVNAWAAEPNAAEPRTLTVTLLPTGENPVGSSPQDPKGAKNFLWIQKDQPQEIRLDFDLSGLPSGLNKEHFKRCVLRLVAHRVIFYPEGKSSDKTGATDIFVRGWSGDDDKNSILALSVLSENNPVVLNANTSEAFRNAVYKKYEGKDKKLSLRLRTNSARASSLFYSSKNFGDTASNKPRLVIEYTLPPPDLLETASWSQHQQNPEHTGRSPWIPFRAPNGFSLVSVSLPKIGENMGTVVDYPLIYQGNLYLISYLISNNLKQNYLISLDFKGTKRWQRVIGEGTVQRSPVISRNGIMYIVTEKQIAGYDLTQSGKDYASHPLSEKKLSAYTGLTQGNDGSLFLAMTENDVNYVYGFTPSLDPFLKVGPFGSGQDKISTITVSPNGRKIFAQTPKGAVVIDVANPSEQRMIPLANNQDQPWEYYYVPVAGPAGDVMIFSDFTSKANRGNIWGYSETQRIWNASGTLLPQPVLGSNGRVYYIQGGALRGHPYNQLGSADITAGTGLNTTSNLVMDGADNIYFWDNGYLHGYSPQAERLFEKVNFTKKGLEEQRPADPESVSPEKKAERSKDSSGPEQFIRLMMGPDGTLWANNKNGNALYAFKPSYASADLTVQQTDIKPQTAYRATGTLTVGGVSIEGHTQVLLQAQNGIGFARGFKVQKGASLVARTGF